jgi:phage-related minor tail protein
LLSTNAGPSTLGDGARAGIASASDRFGTTANNIAGAISDSIGTAAQGVSDIILGWATGANDFFDIVKNVGLSIVQSLLDTLINIGVQQVLNGNAAKAIAIGWKALTSGLRAADTAETVAAETVKTPILATNAALASASSFGLAAVVGIAALALAIGAFIGGFEQGGYTGDGGKSQPAGIVHRGEYVLTQAEVARLGIGRIESFKNSRGYEAGGFVGTTTTSGSGSQGSRPIQLIAVDSRREAQRIAKNSEAESQIFDMIYNRRAELLG